MKKHHLILIIALVAIAGLFYYEGRKLNDQEAHSRKELHMLREAAKRTPAAMSASHPTGRNSAPEMDSAIFSTELHAILKNGSSEATQNRMEEFAKKYQAQITNAPLSKLKELCALLEKEFPLDRQDSAMARRAWLFFVGQAAKSDPAWAFAKFDEAATAAKSPIAEALSIFQHWSSQEGKPMNPTYARALEKWLDTAHAAGRIDDRNPLVGELRFGIATAEGNHPAAIKQISQMPYLSQRKAAIGYVENLQTPEARRGAIEELSKVLQKQNFPHFVSKLAEHQGYEATKEILVSASLTPEKHDIAAASIAASNIGTDTPAKAKWLLESLRSEDQSALAEFSDRWTHTDYHGAAKWIGTLPAGKQRDSAISGFAPAAAKIDGATAVDWALTLTDPAQRKATLMDVQRTWKDIDRDAANAYFREKGIPQDGEL